jgi:hypothetical protein
MLENEGLEKLEEQHSISGLERNKVKILMLQKDIPQTRIVEKYNFDKGDVSKVVHGKRKTKSIREAIAKELGMSIDDVFGASGN